MGGERSNNRFCERGGEVTINFASGGRATKRILRVGGEVAIDFVSGGRGSSNRFCE